MEEGVAKYWTPGQEIRFDLALKSCRSFAQLHHIMFLRDALKYDGRSKGAKRTLNQAKLRLAIATDADLWEIAKLHVSYSEDKPGKEIPEQKRANLVLEHLSFLTELRGNIRKVGINKEAVRLKCL